MRTPPRTGRTPRRPEPEHSPRGTRMEKGPDRSGPFRSWRPPSLLGVLLGRPLELLQLREYRIGVDLLFLLGPARLRRHERLRRRLGGGRHLGRQEGLAAGRGLRLRLVLGGALDLEIEVDLRGKAERHR